MQNPRIRRVQGGTVTSRQRAAARRPPAAGYVVSVVNGSAFTSARRSSVSGPN